MKQKDIALIAVIVVISAVFSIFVSKAIFSSKMSQQQAEVVQPITSSFAQPDKRYFNNQSYDPTKLINIGQNNNSAPFTATQ